MRFAALPFHVDEQPAPPQGIQWNPWEDQPAQLYDWTCSACSLDWVLRSTSLGHLDTDIYSARERTVYEIGYPGNINSQYGLMDSSGSALQDVLAAYGQGSEQGWLDFDTVYGLAQQTPGLMSGAAWYHWVGIRGTQGSNLWIANSAPGYKGIWDTLSRYDFERLGGFSVVWLT